MLTISIVFGLALLIAMVMLIRRVASAGSSLPVTAEWIDELSMERYRPMMRLLDGADVEFLRSQPGFTPKMARTLRMQRYQIFKGYLHCLNSDFQRVCSAIKILMLLSRQDRPDLARILIHHQVMFSLGMMAVHFHLVLYRCGISGVDVSSLMRIFDLMRLELRGLVPAAVPAGA
jgi:hypothetical protein